MADDEKIDAIKMLYDIAIGDIREFKARQWDVTKWPITVILALIIPLFLKEHRLPPAMMIIFLGAGLLLGCWSILVILRLQSSLRDCRQNLEKYKQSWPTLKEFYGESKPDHLCFCYTFYIWGFQIFLILVAMSILGVAYIQVWFFPASLH
jgi:hypothetical protein